MTKKRIHTVEEVLDYLPFTSCDPEINEAIRSGKVNFVQTGHEKFTPLPDGKWKRVACYEIVND